MTDSEIEYVPFVALNPTEWLDVLNDGNLRRHLVEHPLFGPESIQHWLNEKSEIDTLPGCRIRAVMIGGRLAGWCGIQPDEYGYEIAIVLCSAFWGIGIAIFKDMMAWAKEMGHGQLVFHLLDSRPEYKSLRKLACNIHTTELMGRAFTSYVIEVDKWQR